MIVANPASQVVAALIVGLLIAFTCQLLLTNVGVAVGITVWGGSSWQNPEGQGGDRDVSADTADSMSLSTLGLAAGFGLLLTVNGVLFVAAYAAVRYCAPVTPFSGAILGIVVWAAYLLVMTWISTSAANSIVAFILSSAVSGLRQIFDVLGSLMQSVFGDEASSLSSGATAKLIRRETQSTLERMDIPALIEDYIDEKMPPQPDLDALRQQLDDSLQTPDLKDSVQQGLLPQIDLSYLTQWVKDELGLSGEPADAIADLLNQVWQQVTQARPRPLQQLQDLFSNASVEDLTPDAIQPLVERLQQDSDRSDTSRQDPSRSSGTPDTEEMANRDSINGIGRRLRRMLRQRVDLTDIDVQAVWTRISPLLQDWLSDSESLFGIDGQVVREDVDDYLRELAPWRLRAETLEQEFRQVLVDPDAAVDQVLPQLQALNREDLTRSLEQRGDLAREQIESLAADLDEIRQSAIAQLTTADPSAATGEEIAATATDEETEAIATIQQKLENYLHYTSLDQVTPDAIAHKVETLVEEAPVSATQLHQASPQLPTAPLVEVLESRQGLDPARQEALIQQVQEAWQQYTEDTGAVSAEIMVAVEGALVLGISQLVGSNVDVQTLLPKLMEPLRDAVSEPDQLRRSLNQVNWSSLRQKALSQLDATEAQIDQALQQVQLALTDVLKPPKRWALRRSVEAHDFWDSVTEYLANSTPDQLSAEAIQHNLAWLWRSSQQGLSSLQTFSVEAVEDISDIDWSNVKDTLSRRGDLAVEQIEAIWDVLKSFVQQLLHQANQAQQQARASLESWFAAAKSALQNSENLAFDPQQIKADLRELLHHSPDVFEALVQPLTLLDSSSNMASTIAQLSQRALSQVLPTRQELADTLQDQAAGLQTWVQERVAAVEQEIQEQRALLQQAALQRLNDARRAIATAAWWLFAISITSATTATAAGILAVTGFKVLLMGTNTQVISP